MQIGNIATSKQLAKAYFQSQIAINAFDTTCTVINMCALKYTLY